MNVCSITVVGGQGCAAEGAAMNPSTCWRFRSVMLSSPSASSQSASREMASLQTSRGFALASEMPN
jgi:hypothetical protein